MWRLVFYLLVLAIAAVGVAQLPDRPGDVTITWLGYEIETSIYVAAVAVVVAVVCSMLAWSAAHYLVTRPRALRRYLKERDEARGREALTRGIIAAEIGDHDIVSRTVAIAHKILPGDPLTSLLRVKAARLSGDGETARAVLEAMTSSSDTSLAGLHGLYLEAVRENEVEAARQFAERAVQSNPGLGWSIEALFNMQTRGRDWLGALETLVKAERHGQVKRDTARRRRAILLTAQAMKTEETDLDRARRLALEAHKLAPELVPAAALAGRALAAQGSIYHAGRVIKKTWELSPHPDLAMAYAHIRNGDSPRERLNRVSELVLGSDGGIEGAIALARAAIEAQDWNGARRALEPYIGGHLPARICELMAQIEEGSRGDTGRVREWLGRALRAPVDAAWVGDGVALSEWSPVSPVTGELDAVQWMAPLGALESASERRIVEEVGVEEARTAKTVDRTPDMASKPPALPVHANDADLGDNT